MLLNFTSEKVFILLETDIGRKIKSQNLRDYPFKNSEFYSSNSILKE